MCVCVLCVCVCMRAREIPSIGLYPSCLEKTEVPESDARCVEANDHHESGLNRLTHRKAAALTR